MGSWKEGIVNEIHKPVRKNYERRNVTIKGLNDLYQTDLVVMTPYSNENNGYNYLLTMIDTFTKKAWAIPLKTKTGKEVAKAMKKIFEKLKTAPKFLQANQGTEFFNKDCIDVLKSFGIQLHSSFSTLKASIIERFNRTFKTWMWKEFSLRGSYKWIDLLDRLLTKYNNRVHRTTGFAPVNVNEKNEKIVQSRLIKLKLRRKPKMKFKIGQPVRISKYKHIFEKGYTPNWTTEVFIINKICQTHPITYKLRDLEGNLILGGFYTEELLKTKYKDTYLIEKILKRKGSKVFVKWLGFADRYNQWINKSDLES